jgi:fumarate reductase (CoM/CoB) subunit A
MVTPQEVDLDVLVIGGGGAGAMAALWALEEVPRVGLVEKGVFGKSGCTPMGAFSMCAAFGYADPADTPRKHFEDTIKAGRFLNDQDLVDIYTREAPARVEELLSYGAKFDLEGGRLHQAMMPGHSYPRACHYDRRTGPMIMGTLARKVKKTPGIRVFEEVIVIDLLLNPQGPHYALAVRWADSSFVVFRAGAIVVTTGGLAQIYKNNTTSLDNTGDGISLMHKAGAELADMEFVQFYPTTVCSPKLPGLGPTATAFLRIRTGARLYNARGEDFMETKLPGWRFQATRDLLSQAIYKEIIEGRGTANGGVYLDITHLSPEVIRKEYEIGNYYQKLLQIGVDISKRPMETKVSAHFLMGGARVNGRGETNIPGLFAGGEAAAGYHGGNRLGGNALSEILVSGSRAGKHAGIWAKENGKAQLKEKDLGPRLQAWHERVSRWRTRSSGLRPVDGKRRIQDLMWEKGGVIREGGKMKSALDSLKALREEADQTLAISPVRRVNRELLEAFELFHMVTVSDLVLRAAIAREESRGAHYREDFPFPDDSRWLVNLVLKKTGEGLSLRKERVKFIHLKPEGWEDGTEGDEQNKGAAV